jgi:hypothetical protein
MGFWADLNAWLIRVGNSIVTFIVDGVGWIKSYMAMMRADMIRGLQAAMGHPGRMILIITGFVAIQMILSALFDALSKAAWVLKVTAFLSSIGDIIKQLAAWLQLDLMITLMQLGMLLNDGFYKQISRIYVALGELSAELELDFSFITAFVETNRSIIYAMYSITGLSALKAESEYAAGLATFLQGLNARLGDYAEDPSLIFLDVQKAIIFDRLKVAEEQVGLIWTAIDKGADWIKDSGNALLTMVDQINGQLDTLPQELQNTINEWYAPIRARLDTWTEDVWGAFWTDYQAAETVIDRHFLLHDMDIDRIQRELDSPIDLLRKILALPALRRAEELSALDNLVAQGEAAAVAPAVIPIIDSMMIVLGAGAAANIPLAEPIPPAEIMTGPLLALIPVQAPIEGPTLKETGPDVYPPGMQKADGRSWYVGG